MDVMTVMKRLFLLVALLGLFVATSSSAGAVAGSIFVVTSTADTDGDCTSTPTNCTLRQAINAAFSNPGADVINFAIGTEGSTQTIVLTTGLPLISSPVTIDGWSQGGSSYAGAPLIVLDGPGTGVGAVGLRFTYGGSGSTVRGLSIGDFTYGISGGSGATALTIYGNYLGLKPDGQPCQTSTV